MTAAELDAALTRWFFADSLDAATRARLIAAALAFARDRPAMLGQVGQFAPDDPIGHGVAWWEARQRGAGTLVQPISELDHALMLWTSEPRLDPRPAPRPHCPAELGGRWQLAGTSRDEVTIEPPAAPRTWTLGADGRLDGDRERAGWGWRVHEGMIRALCLGPEDDPLRERWTILDLRGDQLDLIPPDQIRGFERYRHRHAPI